MLTLSYGLVVGVERFNFSTVQFVSWFTVLESWFHYGSVFIGENYNVK